MLNKDTVAMLIGMGAIVVTLGVGTCSTNRRIDDGFENLQRQIGDVHRRMDDGFGNLQRQIGDVHRRMDDGFGNLQRQIDNLQTDVRELRTLHFETPNDEPPAG